MTRPILILLFGALFGPAVAAQTASPAAAALHVETLAVENMTCALCPITVRAAMAAVDGVRAVAVDLESRTATVTIDPAVTSIEAVARASAEAGYPARPQS